MSNGQYSSVMLIATDGLLQNQGLNISGNLIVAINAYTSTTVVSSYLDILSSAFANVGIANDQITTNTFSSLQTLAASNLPAITDAVPAAYAANLVIGNSTTGFSGLVTTQANLVLGSGDISIFAQVYNLCQSYIAQNNPIINTVKNSSTLAPTFTNMNSLSTGGISDINRTLPVFGEDLQKLGQAWDLTNLIYFGFPSALLFQLAKAGGLLPELTAKLDAAGLTTEQLNSVLSGASATTQVEGIIYQVMLDTTGTALDQVKTILDVTTPNLTTMADLLNPVKSLPNSYLQLTIQAPTGGGPIPVTVVLTNIYSAAATVNNVILPMFINDEAYRELAKIIPSDQALANRAIANSLGQVKNISQLTLPAFTTAVRAIETNTGLGDINALTQPVPTSTSTNLNSLLATGTGPNGTLTLFDFMGATAGIPYTAEFTAAANTINNMQAANSLYYLSDATNGVYTVMQDTLNGDYTVVVNPGPPIEITITIPPGLPGAGTYLSLDDAFTVGLLPAAANLIANVVTANPGNVTSLNSNFSNMAAQLSAEKTNLALAQVNFADITGNSRSAVMSLGSNLQQIGKDVAPQGQAEFFTAIANTQNIYGQAIESSFREGRNIAALNEVGIGIDSQIPGSSA
jgi:hypothetical protein